MSITCWGIVGTGKIARQFARGLSACADAKLVAVASRSEQTAHGFANEFNIPNRHVGVQSLAADPNVDAVYIAALHPMHKSTAIICLEAGKAVLCEKPFTLNASEAIEVVKCARRKGMFLMEALWTHFFPAMAKMRELIAARAIGEIRIIQSNFCFRGEPDLNGRLLNRELGGGALLDVGVYNLSLAHMIMGREPTYIVSGAHIGKQELTSNLL